MQMRRMPYCAAVLVALVVLSSAAGVGSAAGQTVFDDRESTYFFGGVRFPAVVDTFAVLSVSRFPQTAYGVSLRYASPIDPSARFDVIVYPSVTPTAAELRAEFDRSVEGIRMYAGQNPSAFQILEMTEDSIATVDAEGRPHLGWVAEARVMEQGVEQRSLLYLFLEDGSYIKYRLSYAVALEAGIRPRMEAFLRQTLEEVRADAVVRPPGSQAAR